VYKRQLKVLNLPETYREKKINYTLKLEGKEQLDNSKTFDEVGIENFDLINLTIASQSDSPTAEKLKTKTKDSGKGKTVDLELSQVLKENKNLPLWKRIPINRPSLISPDGIVFILGDPPITIGRKSRHFTPSIDISKLDTSRLCSRHHADILKKGVQYELLAMNTTNGTYINNNELPAEKRQALNDGDEISFGFGGAVLIFRMPK